MRKIRSSHLLLLLLVMLMALAAAAPASAAGAEDDELEWFDGSDFILQAGGMETLPPMPYATATQINDAAAAIATGLKAKAETISLSTYQLTEDETKIAYIKAVNNNPSLFYVRSAWAVAPNSNGLVASIKPCYYYQPVTYSNGTSDPALYNKSAVAGMQTQYEAAVQEALSCVDDGMTDLEKALVLHDWLALRAHYDYTYSKRNAYNAMVEGTCVCQGYTLAYIDLMQRAGVPVGYVTSDRINHIWNLVGLDDEWYNVDVTWDDPSPNEIEVPGRVDHDYFLITDATSITGHFKNVDPSEIDATNSDGQSCTDATYESAFWTDVGSAIYPQADHSYFYVGGSPNNVKLSKAASPTGATETLATWSWAWTSSGGTWNGCHSRLVKAGVNQYLLSGPSEVYLVKANSGVVTVQEPAVYTYSGAGQIYGMKIAGENLELLISTTPNMNDETSSTETVALSDLGLGEPATFEGSLGDKLHWRFDPARSWLEITALSKDQPGAMPDFTNAINVPWHGVRGKIKNVTIHEGVTSIGDYAFTNCTQLSSVEIWGEITRVGSNAFLGCNDLGSVTWYGSPKPDWNNVTIINQGNTPFIKIQKKSILGGAAGDPYWTLDNGTLFLFGSGGGSAMTDYDSADKVPWNAYRSQITGVQADEYVTRIGNYAFKGCANLWEVHFKNPTVTLGTSAFADCGSLGKVYFYGEKSQWAALRADRNDGNTPLDSASVSYRVTKTTNGVTWKLSDGDLDIYGDGTMPDYASSAATPWKDYRSDIQYVGVWSGTHIGSYAFADCENLYRAGINGDISTIGASAFSGCSSLSQIYLPDSLTAIGANAFKNCGNLQHVYFYGDKPTWDQISGSEQLNSDNITIHFTPHGSFGDDDEMFWSFSDGTLEISGYGEVPDFASAADTPWYGYRDEITRIILDSGIQSIGKNAFNGLSKATNVIIYCVPKTIGANAFNGCSALNTVYFRNEKADWEKISINSTGNNKLTSAARRYYLSDALHDTDFSYYISWNLWLDELNVYGFGDIPASTTPWSVGKSYVTSVYVNLPSVDKNAFKDFTALKHVNFGGSVKAIGESAFSGCKALEWVYIGSSVTDIGKNAFNNCTALKYADLSQGVKTIGEGAFSGCAGLKSVSLSSDLTSIGKNAFKNCTALTDITYHGSKSDWETLKKNSVTTGNDPIFKTGTPTCVLSGWTGGLNWTLNGSTLVISGNGPMPDYSEQDPQPWADFRDDVELVILYDGVTVIGAGAFKDCANLLEVQLPASLTNIYDEAFDGCEKLEHLCYKGTSNEYKRNVTVSQYGNDCLADARFTDIQQKSGKLTETLSWLLTDGNLSVYGTGAMPDYDPEGLNGKPVQPWADSLPDIRSIAVGEGVTHIGDNAFNGCENPTALAKVREVMVDDVTYMAAVPEPNSKPRFVTPSSVTSIGNSAFENCATLEMVELPAGLMSLGDAAFAGCGTLMVVFNSEVPATLGDNVFKGCDVQVHYPPGYAASWKALIDLPEDDPARKLGANTIEYLEDLQPGEHSITLDPNGGAFTNAGQRTNFIVPANKTLKDGLKAAGIVDTRGNGALPTPTRTGYNFQGWYNVPEETGGTKVTESTKPTGEPTRITLYARWQLKEITVTLNGNGGKVNGKATTTFKLKYGETYSANLPDLTNARPNFTFLGWFTEQAGGERVTAADKMLNEANFTLYAHWQGAPCAVSFDLNYEGAPAGTAPESVNTYVETAYGEILKGVADPTRKGYVFQGWSLAAKAGSKPVKETDKLATSGTLKLYAQWKVNDKIQVTLDANGGSFGRDHTKVVNATFDKPYPLSNPTNSNKSLAFDGWYLEEDFKTLVTKDTKVANDAAHTLYAKWGPVKYDVTYDANGGIFKADAIQQAYGNAMTLGKGEKTATERRAFQYQDAAENTLHLPDKAMLSRDGHTFVGWSWTKNGSVDDPSVLREAKKSTLYAVWVGAPVKVTLVDAVTGEPATYKDDKGHTIDPFYVEYSGVYGNLFTEDQVENGAFKGTPPAQSKLPTPDRTGWTFDSWAIYTKQTNGKVSLSKIKDNTVVKASGEVMLAATWKGGPVNVTFHIDPVYSALGVTPVTKPEKLTNGAKLSLPTPKAPTGMKFVGWHIDDEPTVDVLGNATFPKGTKAIEKNQTLNVEKTSIDLYAEFEPLQYLVTVMDAIPSNDPNKSKVNWTGWSEDSKTAGKYTKAVYTLDTYGLPELTELNETVEKGYFYGWFTSKTPSATTMLANPEKFTLGKNQTLYLVKAPMIFTVKLELNGASLTKGKTNPIFVENGKKYTTLFSPTLAKYKFAGWYNDPDFNDPIFTTSTPVTAVDFDENNSLTLYAKWTYNVTVKPGTGVKLYRSVTGTGTVSSFSLTGVKDGSWDTMLSRALDSYFVDEPGSNDRLGAATCDFWLSTDAGGLKKVTTVSADYTTLFLQIAVNGASNSAPDAAPEELIEEPVEEEPIEEPAEEPAEEPVTEDPADEPDEEEPEETPDEAPDDEPDEDPAD